MKTKIFTLIALIAISFQTSVAGTREVSIETSMVLTQNMDGTNFMALPNIMYHGRQVELKKGDVIEITVSPLRTIGGPEIRQIHLNLDGTLKGVAINHPTKFIISRDNPMIRYKIIGIGRVNLNMKITRTFSE